MPRRVALFTAMLGTADSNRPPGSPGGDPAMIRAMRDWERFLEEVTWFLAPGESASVGDTLPWSRGAVERLPQLSRLLAAATVTPVSVEGRAYELLAWGPSDSRRGWLCLPPENRPVEGVHAIHQHFLTVCGGIVERFGEPISWWNNQNEVLTASAARLPLAPVLHDYAWLSPDDGLEIPIDPDEYYVVAVEANGNLTLAQRSSGRVLLFAPDHSFEGVAPLPGCTPYSLMTIDDAPDLTAWIECCAEAWSDR